MKILITLLIGFLSTTLLAKEIEGYIIDQGDSTKVVLYVKALFGVISLENNNLEFEFTRNGGEKETVFPKEGLSIVFKEDGVDYLYMSLPKFKMNNSKDLFFTHVNYYTNRMLVVAAIKTGYNPPVYNSTTGGESGGGVTNSTVNTFYSKEKGYLEFGLFNFRKKAKVYFSDCPELVSKIQDKEFIEFDLQQIAAFYNQCKSK